MTLGRSIFLITLWAALGAWAWGQSSPSTQAAGGPAVPEAALVQLRAEMVPPDNKKVEDLNKIRRYRSILRKGRELERTYPEAGNLYLVESLMLEAIRGLVEMQTEDVQPQEVFDLAGRIVASSAPPAFRIGADTILTQVAVTKLTEAAASQPKPAPHRERLETPVEKVLHAFVSRYAEPAVEPDALINAATMAQDAGEAQAVREFGDRLENAYYDEPRVRVFFRERLGRLVRNEGQSVAADLPLLDGTTLRLPRDLFGQVVLLHFWSPKNQRCLAALEPLKKIYQELHPRGLEIVSVCVDHERADLDRVIQEHALPWRQVYSGKGVEDPLVRSYGVQGMPSYWIVGPEGRIIQDCKTVTQEYLGTMRGSLLTTVERSWRLMAWLEACRSGEFLRYALLDRVAAASAPATQPALPAERWTPIAERIQEAGLTYPPERKALLMEEIRKLCRAAEEAYPHAAELPAVRNFGLIATQWLALQRHDRGLEAEAVAAAQHLLESNPPLPRRILADYLVTRMALFKGHAEYSQETARIRDFVARYDQPPTAWMASLLGTALALETGHWRVADELRAKMGTAALSDQPEIRSALRFFTESKLDVGIPFEAQLTRLDGRPLKLPDDLLGNVVVVHFCTSAAPPGAPWTRPTLINAFSAYQILQAKPGVAIVAVNLDRSREAAAEMAKQHPDWIVTHSGLEAAAPLVRRYGVYALPTTWVIGCRGRTVLTDLDYIIGSGTITSAEYTLWQIGQSPPINLEQHWQRAGDYLRQAEEQVETARILLAKNAEDDNWVTLLQPYNEPPGFIVEHYKNYIAHLETASESLFRTGFKLVKAQIEARVKVLASKLAQLKPGKAGGWEPTEARQAANLEIAAILEAQQKMPDVLKLAAGRGWAKTADLHDFVQAAAEKDCLRVPQTPAGETQRKELARFFPEVPVPVIPTTRPANQPAAAPGYWLFRLKLL